MSMRNTENLMIIRLVASWNTAKVHDNEMTVVPAVCYTSQEGVSPENGNIVFQADPSRYELMDISGNDRRRKRTVSPASRRHAAVPS